MLKKLLKATAFSIAFFCLISEVNSQSVSIDGQLRPRFEYRNGYKTLSQDGVDAAFFVSQRTRLNLNYSGTKFKVGFSIQDVRVWGDVPQLNKSDFYGPAIHQAWGEIIFNKTFAVKVGRQEIVYDDQRIFGNVGWAQQARSHDAAILKVYPIEKAEINLGFAYNQNNEALFGNVYTLKNYKAFQYLWYHQSFEKFSVSFLALNNGMPYWDNKDTLNLKQRIVYSQTIGPRVTFKSGIISANAAFYYQTGQMSPASDTVNFATSLIDLSAFYAAADVAFQITDLFSAGIGFEYLSGNSQVNPKANESNAFTPFYGTNHKFNGWMDYFYVKNHVNSVGLLDIYLPIKFNKGKFGVVLVPHSFQAAADIHDPNSTDPKATISKDLGFEVDLAVSYAVAKNVVVKAGYSQMFATSSMEAIKNVNSGSGSANNWGWVMIVFNPNFYTSK